MAKFPVGFERFLREYPEIAVAYETLGNAIHNQCPLTEKERAITN